MKIHNTSLISEDLTVAVKEILKSLSFTERYENKEFSEIFANNPKLEQFVDGLKLFFEPKDLEDEPDDGFTTVLDTAPAVRYVLKSYGFKIDPLGFSRENGRYSFKIIEL